LRIAACRIEHARLCRVQRLLVGAPGYFRNTDGRRIRASLRILPGTPSALGDTWNTGLGAKARNRRDRRCAPTTPMH
jgi:hypothetical protein